MMSQAIVVPSAVKYGARSGLWATYRPPTSAISSSTMPTAVASRVRPGRHTFIQKPIRSAIGMVQAMVNMPHGLSRSALTTTSASTASRMTMMARMASIAARPVAGPISSLAIWPERLAVPAHGGRSG